MNESSITSKSTPAAPGAFSVPVHPPRKRRRPALSCVQCRRRKVKCDRKLPCTQCSQYNNTACVYDDPEVLARNKESRSTNQRNQGSHNISSALPDSNNGFQKTGDSSLFANQPISTHPASEPRSQSANVPWGAPPLAEQVRPYQQDQQAPGIPSGVLTPQSEPSVQELKDRVRKLEEIVSRSLNHGQSPTEHDTNILTTNVPKLRGNIDKTRFFGMSHWMNTYDDFDQLRSLKNYDKFDNGSEVQKLLKRCKEMARVVKAERPISSYTLPDFKSHVPPRETSDQLVQLYFRTFESTSRILHRGLFFKEYEQYWSNPAAGSTSFVIKLLLIMAIGTALYDDGTTRSSLRSLAPQWIYSAQIWLSSPFAKSRLNLAGLEVECLLVLARQTHSLNGDLIWVTVGALIRTAMSMGLHRDPSHFPKISVLQAELRRRLWATVIELATQCSLDCGMPPMFSFYEFDCEPPSNYDDADLDEQTKSYPPRKPDSVFTDSSIQIALLRSLRTRLEICRMINDFRSNPPYEKVLALSTELTSHIRSHSQLYHASKSSKNQFTTSHKNLLDLLTRRFILALHHPYAVQARTDPRYYFSRKMALDASMIVLSHPETGDSSAEDFTRMRLMSWGLFKEVISRASTAVALELITQINEDPSASMPGSSTGSTSRAPLHEAVETLVSLARRRVEFGVETNVKCYLFLSMLQAQTLAMEKGEDVLEAITGRAKRAMEEAYWLLRKQVTLTPVEGPTPASREDGISEGTGESNVDWDFLMQDTMMGFDATNTWLFDSWEDAHNSI